MKAAAITSVRNDKIFLDKWIDYYGQALGYEHLYVIIDGYDQPLPKLADRVNIFRFPHMPLGRVPAMRRRARLVSDIARGLHRFFDAVIGLDVDEFLIPDPDKYSGLFQFLESQQGRYSSVSGLGLDVGQNLNEEGELDPSEPFLGQRRFAHLSTRYTKPAISFQPVTWGSGFHRVKGRNFRIHPDLYLFHFGMIDYAMSTGKTADKDRLATGWGGHLERREALFKIIAEATPEPFETTTQKARKTQSLVRPLYAWNKPSLPGRARVVEIPERFFGLV